MGDATGLSWGANQLTLSRVNGFSFNETSAGKIQKSDNRTWPLGLLPDTVNTVAEVSQSVEVELSAFFSFDKLIKKIAIQMKNIPSASIKYCTLDFSLSDLRNCCCGYREVIKKENVSVLNDNRAREFCTRVFSSTEYQIDFQK